jgi:hypothetical protein
MNGPAATARKVLLNSGRRTHAQSLPLDGSKPLPQEPVEEPDFSSSIEKEPAMPRGIYPRKKRKAASPDDGVIKKKRARKGPGRRAAKAAVPAAGDVLFGYFSDGSLSIAAPNCKGTLSQAQLQLLAKFTKRFEGAA